MTQQDDVIRLEDPTAPGALIILDFRHFPVVFQALIGAPSMEMAEMYFERRRAAFERARAKNTKFAIVSDLSKMGSPQATVRKRMGELAQTEDDHSEFLGYFICVPSAILRGVVTALKWIAGDDVKPVTMVGSVNDAVTQARKALESNGVNVPSFEYTPPT